MGIPSKGKWVMAEFKCDGCGEIDVKRLPLCEIIVSYVVNGGFITDTIKLCMDCQWKQLDFLKSLKKEN